MDYIAAAVSLALGIIAFIAVRAVMAPTSTLQAASSCTAMILLCSAAAVSAVLIRHNLIA